MLIVRVTDNRTSEALRSVPAIMESEQRDHMESIGLYLVSECKIDFEAKSRGGESHKIKWKSLNPSTERAKARKGGWKGATSETPPSSQINVDTGLLRNSQTPGFSALGADDEFRASEESVTVGYGMKYAKYVDEVRTLIPNETPKEWVEECEKMTQEWLEELIRKSLT